MSASITISVVLRLTTTRWLASSCRLLSPRNTQSSTHRSAASQTIEILSSIQTSGAPFWPQLVCSCVLSTRSRSSTSSTSYKLMRNSWNMSMSQSISTLCLVILAGVSTMTFWRARVSLNLIIRSSHQSKTVIKCLSNVLLNSSLRKSKHSWQKGTLQKWTNTLWLTLSSLSTTERC